MHSTFWIFTTLLLTMTILSSFGGGMRYTENFMDDILDDSDIDLSTYDVNELKHTLVSAEPQHQAPQHQEPNNQILPKDVTLPINQPNNTLTASNDMPSTINAFDGDTYALF